MENKEVSKYYFYDKAIEAMVAVNNAEFDGNLMARGINLGKYVQTKNFIKELFDEKIEVELQRISYLKVVAIVKNVKTKEMVYKVYLN